MDAVLNLLDSCWRPKNVLRRGLNSSNVKDKFPVSTLSVRCKLRMYCLLQSKNTVGTVKVV